MFSGKTIAKIGSIFLIVTFLLTGALPAQKAVAATSETINLSAEDWAQIYTLVPSLEASIPPDTQQAYLKASNTGASDFFGYPMALSGDTLVIGAYNEDSNAVGVNGNQADNSASDSGAVYVFIRSGGVWSQQAYLKASNPNVDDSFGDSVDISGDTIVVGTAYEDSNATGVNGNQLDNSADTSGAAYVFTRTGTTWSQQAYLKASNTDAGDYFGKFVRISGDTIAVTAYYEDSNATGINGNQADNSAEDSGATYIFTRTGSTWSQQAYVKASNAEAFDYFGYYAMALSGDTLAVASSYEASSATGVNGNQADNSAPYSGAVYVFTRTGSTWSQQAYLKASNTKTEDYFGYPSMSLSGDTLAVAASYEDSNATGVNGNQADTSAVESGAVYVFTRTGSTWSQQAYIKASNTEAGDYFGTDVSLSGDILAVGASDESSNATGVNGDQANNSALYSGAAYIFTRTGTNWYQHSYLKASNTEASDYFGYSLSLSGNTVAVGAYGEDSNATGVNGNQADNSALNSGAAYVFTIAPVFDDVPFSYWANNFVERLAKAGVTGGCGTGIYCPDSTVTRAQMAVFLLKGIHGSSYTPPAVGVSTGFGDVATDYWAAAWIKQLAAEGVTSGCGGGNYCPDSVVTRAQMAIFLLKARNGSGYTPPAVGVSTGFADVATDAFGAAFIKQLVADGITAGCGGGNYCPNDSVTRAQMAVFLVRAFNLP
ncbi:MAG: S-layer homology domain-containing protein [Anaerolineales bacterium]|nr:S-layer homology domain-containing protein [Anaerolineales bacterium]